MKVSIEEYIYDAPEANQEISVKIDTWDTWSMDSTLAHIIVPMLKQLKSTQLGGPDVDLEDVPTGLHPTEEELLSYTTNSTIDEKFFARWHWVLDEMIWSFEQKCRDWWEEDYYGHHTVKDMLEDQDEKFDWTLVVDAPIWVDTEGRKAHQERMAKGFKLFGKYYESLWD